MGKIRVGIVGVGNCASSLVQGINYYSSKKNITGLLHRKLGNYSVKDIEIVAAFDIDKRKVGKTLSEAIFAKPNNTVIFQDKIKEKNIIVQMGKVLDGFPKHLLKFPEDERFVLSKEKPVNIVKVLRETKPDFLICYLPVGSIKAVQYYAKQALSSGVSFINAMPVFIASNSHWVDKFRKRGLLVIGDDVKSQVGATIVHRVLTNIFKERGAVLDKTYQINFAGNTDFLNMLDKKRLALKWQSKIESVKSQYGDSLNDIYAGPAEYIRYLKDNKIAYINLQGKGFGGLPIEIELKLSVIDSTSSAGVIVDVLRLSKIAKDRGFSGTVLEICAFGFKRPLKQYNDGIVFEKLKEWISKNTGD